MWRQQQKCSHTGCKCSGLCFSLGRSITLYHKPSYCSFCALGASLLCLCVLQSDFCLPLSMLSTPTGPTSAAELLGQSNRQLPGAAVPAHSTCSQSHAQSDPQSVLPHDFLTCSVATAMKTHGIFSKPYFAISELKV